MDLRLANEQDLNASESTTEQNEQQFERAHDRGRQPIKVKRVIVGGSEITQ